MHSSLSRQPSNLLNSYKMQKASSSNLQYHHSPLIQMTTSHFHTNAVNRFNYYHQHHDDSTINCLTNQIPHEMTSNNMEEVNTTKSIPIKGSDSDDNGDACAEQIVVNSILYKKASSSRMVVDIGAQITQALLMGHQRHYHEHQPKSSSKMNNSYRICQSKERAYMSDLEKLLSCEQQNSSVAEWYVMSTTINGSIEHHITGFCANLLNMILKETKHFDTKDKGGEGGDDSDDDSDAESLAQCITNNNDAGNSVNVDNIMSFDYRHRDRAESDNDDSEEDNDDDSFIQFISDDENDGGIIHKTFPYGIFQNDLSYEIDSDNMVAEDEDDDDTDDDDDDHGDAVVTTDCAMELNPDLDNQSSSAKQSVNITNVEDQNVGNNTVDTIDGEVCMPNTSLLHHRLHFHTRMRRPQNSDKRRKKVCFNNQPEVHIMHTWSYAYRAARKGHWEMYARDRARFKLRIERTAEQLEPILRADHRYKIYNDRFVPFYQQQSAEMLLPLNKTESTQCIKHSGKICVENVEKYRNKQRKRKRKATTATTPEVSLSVVVTADTAKTKTKLALLKCKNSDRHNLRRRRRLFKTPVVLFYCYIF